MSGRSAFVRREKAKCQDKGRPGITSQYPSQVQFQNPYQQPVYHNPYQQPQYQPQYPPQFQSQPQLAPRPSHNLQRGPPVEEYTEYEPARETHRRRSSSIHGGSIGSGPSHWSTDQSSYRKPPVVPVATGIEKSSFRSFMDSKSNAFRSKLSTKFSAKNSDHDHHNDRGESRGSGQAYYELAASQPPMLSQPPRPRTAQRAESRMSPDSSLRSIEQAAPIKQWIGGRQGGEQWNNLRRDPELWDPSGDTLVFFGHQSQREVSRMSPSFRIRSSTLEDTGSGFFYTILQEGYRFSGSNGHAPRSPSSPPASSASMSGSNGRVLESQASNYDQQPFPLRHPKVPSTINSLAPRSTQLTPPLSDSNSSDDEFPILHEVFFPPPVDATKVDILRHHLTTRNVIALLLGKPLVGLNLFQTLLDLHERLLLYMPPEKDVTNLMIEHVVSNKLDDLRNDPAAAAGLLAWSEGAAVRWLEGWREAFVHCAGMFTKLQGLPEYRDISPVTRALLERAHLERQVRIQRAEERLRNFDFMDLWPMQSVQPPAARSSFERLQKFLAGYYGGLHWAWPPTNGESSWLNREIVRQLQKDFAAVYDYFVDRDVTWEQVGHSSDKKARIVSKNRGFQADGNGLAMTDMLNGYDTRCKYPHIPHPFPLLPASIPPQYAGKSSSLFGGKKNRSAEEKTTERQTILAYAEASNIYQLGSDFVSNDLVDAFVHFEKSDQVGEIDPYDARKGRWILVYCILQVLATLSVDTPHIRYTENVKYFLNPRLRGTPPWRARGDAELEEASQTKSHCWKVAAEWRFDDSMTQASSSPSRGHRQILINTEGIGNGTGRSWASSASEGSGSRSASTEKAQERVNRPQAWLDGGAVSPEDERESRNARSTPGTSPEDFEGKIKEWPIQRPRAIVIGHGRDPISRDLAKNW